MRSENGKQTRRFAPGPLSLARHERGPKSWQNYCSFSTASTPRIITGNSLSNGGFHLITGMPCLRPSRERASRKRRGDYSLPSASTMAVNCKSRRNETPFQGSGFCLGLARESRYLLLMDNPAFLSLLRKSSTSRF